LSQPRTMSKTIATLRARSADYVDRVHSSMPTRFVTDLADGRAPRTELERRWREALAAGVEAWRRMDELQTYLSEKVSQLPPPQPTPFVRRQIAGQE
jgi:hypothetical protein